MISRIIKVEVGSASADNPYRDLDYSFNRIYNKILDRDWFSARLFVT